MGGAFLLSDVIRQWPGLDCLCSIATEPIRTVNYFPGVFQRANQIRDISCTEAAKGLLMKWLILPFMINSCLYKHNIQIYFGKQCRCR